MVVVMKIGAAEAGGFDLYRDFVVCWGWSWSKFEAEVLCAVQDEGLNLRRNVGHLVTFLAPLRVDLCLFVLLSAGVLHSIRIRRCRDTFVLSGPLNGIVLGNG